MTNTTQVLIAGAGPTGLMLALELAQRGIALRIVDKLAQASPYSRALVVHARTLELFQNLCVDRAFVDAGFRTIGISAYVQNRHVADIELGDIGAAATPFPFVLFISQAETERILTEALAERGIMVERAVTLAGFAQDHDGVTATLEREDGARCELKGRPATVRS
jgi:2-polyprenyl-6-methoxyphenol hydroxylase-like FAD-dependent oxidoreductase